MSINKVLKVKQDSELLSFIINVTPELASEIDLPKQSDNIADIGKLIMSNNRFRNAFINTVNLIGLTVIKRNGWDNPWEDFTIQGTLNFGQSVREIVLDLARVYDYNEEFSNKTKFLETVVPDVYNYIHELNYQKFYQTTTSDAQLAMAFNTEGGLFDFIETAIGMLYESLKYDRYIVDKYMLCRRIVDGTVPTKQIQYDEDGNRPRQNVSFIKSISNKMSFRSPNFNPAGVNRATKFDEQILIVSTEFEAEFSTEVLATSFFKDEADMRARMVLIDGYDTHDIERLTELLGDKFVPFTYNEIEQLKTVMATLISKEWFMDYYYSFGAEGNMKATEFYNPTTLENNHFLHAWLVFSTSPFENCCCINNTVNGVQAVQVTPSEASITAGVPIKLSAIVEGDGIFNKAVTWSIDEISPSSAENENIYITLDGTLYTPVDSTATQVVVKATSVYNPNQNATATITIL